MIKIAVAGVGRMGSRHASNIYKGATGEAKLVAVCDRDKNALDKFCNGKSVKAYTDFEQMLSSEKLDAVVVATPHYSHTELCISALKKGISVLVEKPITVTVKDAQKIVNVAKSHPEAIFAIMYNQRSNRLYANAKKAIEQGLIGDLQRAQFTVTDWYRTQFYYDMGGWRASWSGEGGGTLINQCVHQLDLLQWILGMPDTIKARCKTVGRNISTENDVTAMLGYKNYDCIFTASTHEFPGVNRFEIVGSKGTITITRHKAVYKILKMDEKEINSRAKRDYGNGCDKKYKKKTYYYGIKNYLIDAFYGQQCNILRDFVKAVAKKDKTLLRAQGEEGLNALNLINAMNMSAWSNSEVNVPVDPDDYKNKLAQKIEQENTKK